MESPFRGSGCGGFDGVELFYYPQRSDGWNRPGICVRASRLPRAVCIYYYSSVFIKSDNKAVTRAEDCVYTRLDFYVSVLFHWFQKVKTP